MTVRELREYAKEIGCCLGYEASRKDSTIQAIETHQHHVDALRKEGGMNGRLVPVSATVESGPGEDVTVTVEYRLVREWWARGGAQTADVLGDRFAFMPVNPTRPRIGSPGAMTKGIEA